MLTVKILGSGCANCKKLEAVAREAATSAGVEAEFETTIALRAAADAAGVPVIFSRVEYSPGGAEGGLFYRKIPHILGSFDTGNPLADFTHSNNRGATFKT